MKTLLLFSASLLLFSCATPRKPSNLQGELDFSAAQGWRPHYTGAALACVSGAAWGVHETSVHHPDRFPSSWNKQFWDNRESWRNKYRDGDPSKGPAYPGSTTVLAWTTDAKHLFGTVHRTSLYASAVVITIGRRRPVAHYLLDAGLSFAAFSLGFHGIYSLAFR